MYGIAHNLIQQTKIAPNHLFLAKYGLIYAILRCVLISQMN